MDSQKEKLFEQVYRIADAKGREAAENCKPTPIVVHGSNPEEQWYIPDGVCGFAWINIRPANSPFGHWLRKKKIVTNVAYGGGYNIWVSDFGQSMARKEAYARAFANTLRRSLQINAFAQSRMD